MGKQLHLKGKDRAKKKIATKAISLGCHSVCIKKSNHYVYALVYDDKRHIMKSFSTKSLGSKNKEATISLAKTVAEFCKSKNLAQLIFDRGGYRYHGNVREFAEVLRQEAVIR